MKNLKLIFVLLGMYSSVLLGQVTSTEIAIVPGSSCGAVTTSCDDPNVICFDIVMTVDFTDVLSSYTFFISEDNCHIESVMPENTSCIMTDNSLDPLACHPDPSIGMVFRSTANSGTTAIMAGVPTVIHTFCVTMLAGETQLDFSGFNLTTDFINTPGDPTPIIVSGASQNSTIICPDCATVSVKAFLQGPYQTSGVSGQMTTKLYEHHLLPGMDKDLSWAFTVRLKATHTPFGHPYSVSPWDYTDYLGAQFGDTSHPNAPDTVISYDSDVTDWVLVTVREDSVVPSASIWRCAAWLHSDGSVSFPDTCGCLEVDTSSDYYIMVEHRNHIGVLSPQPVEELSGGDTLSWDFTTSDSYKPFSFRDGQKQMSDGTWVMYAGNSEVLTGGESITKADQDEWNLDQNDIDYLNGDHTLNVVANSEDETIWRNNLRRTSGVLFY